MREIAFHHPDGSLMKDDGVAETALWDVYERVKEGVAALEAAMRAKGEAEGGMSLLDAIHKVKQGLSPPLTAQEELYLQWHLETEFGGDYAEDAHNLSFFHCVPALPSHSHSLALPAPPSRISRQHVPLAPSLPLPLPLSPPLPPPPPPPLSSERVSE